ncbi:MAG: metalloenzyme [Lentisphaerae bacterium]|nr:metalloenzyme [Lentisphaerota bacterium]
MTPRVLLLFVDGLGLGESDPAVNPVLGGACPVLARWLAEEAVPVDACLGVPGLPQSATGQAALLTGVNAPRAMGRHVEGFPGPALQEIVRSRNLLRRASAAGRRATFANAYFMDAVTIAAIRRPSVTTVAALSAGVPMRGPSDLTANRAVYQDLTREGLRPRGYEGPLVDPAEAGAHLAAIAEEHDLTLFEFFQTDRAGHSGERSRAEAVLSRYDRFLETALRFAEAPGRLVLLSSDHGNIEDLGVRTHTRNPVPLAARGTGADSVRAAVRDLTDIAPAIAGALGLPPG